MYRVTPYHLKKFGHNLTAAAIEVDEITTRFKGNFTDPFGTEQKTTLVRVSVWANEAAKLENKQPIETTEEFIDMSTVQADALEVDVLDILFPPVPKT